MPGNPTPCGQHASSSHSMASRWQVPRRRKEHGVITVGDFTFGPQIQPHHLKGCSMLCRVRAWARQVCGQPARTEEPGYGRNVLRARLSACRGTRLGPGRPQCHFAAFATPQAWPLLQLLLTCLSEADTGHLPVKASRHTPHLGSRWAGLCDSWLA